MVWGKISSCFVIIACQSVFKCWLIIFFFYYFIKSLTFNQLLVLICPFLWFFSAPCPSLLHTCLQCINHPSLTEPVSGTHVNCGNEGHPEEQLESFSVSTTLPVGKIVPGVFLTRTPKTPYASLPPPHTSLRLPLRKIITEPRAREICEIYSIRFNLSAICLL